MYADKLTESMEKAISETNRRRGLQEEYNRVNNIVPQTIKKDIRASIKASIVEEATNEYNISKEADLQEIVDKLTEEMLKYASQMEFEKAAELRDKVKELTGE